MIRIVQQEAWASIKVSWVAGGVNTQAVQSSGINSQSKLTTKEGAGNETQSEWKICIPWRSGGQNTGIETKYLGLLVLARQADRLFLPLLFLLASIQAAAGLFPRLL